jgi:LmbE family N-acetylglucosaminyl deacetylase
VLLAVTAHPDDEAFLFGGSLALHARAGGRSVLVCLTDGESGRTGGLVPRAALGARRREELLRAAEILGIPEVIALGLPDGGLNALGDEEGTKRLRAIFDRTGAEVLLTFGPEGASGHPDHQACWRWTRAAAGGRRLYAAAFPERMPELPRRGGPGLPPTAVIDVRAVEERKRAAFLAHETQRDHLALFDAILEAFGGKEYYHRAHPPFPAGAPLETSLTGR